MTWLSRLTGSRPGTVDYEAFFNLADAGMIVTDAGGHIQAFNPVCEKMFHAPRPHVIGRAITDILPGLDTRSAGTAAQVVAARPMRGLPFQVEVSLTRDEQGGGSMATVRVAGAEADDTGADLTTVLDTMVDTVVLADTSGRIERVNAAFSRLFGYQPQEVIGRNVSMLMPGRHASAHDGYLRNYLGGHEPKIIGKGREVVGLRKDGSEFPMYLSVGDCRKGAQRFFVGIIHDMSEVKLAETKLARAQKMEAVGQIAGGVAHDFNNLLTVILGNIDLVRDQDDLSADAGDLLATVALAAERGAQLTARLLAFSRRQVLRPIPTDCNELISDLNVLVRRSIRADIAIEMQLGDGLAMALADPAQLEMAVLNLVMNAQDAMPTGGTLTLATSEIELDESYQGANPEIMTGRYIMLAITDTGVGMTDDILERVFEPFFTTKDVGKGTGLGLSMVYGFVKQSGGHVTVYSETGIGTTIRMYLPLAGAERFVKDRTLPKAPPVTPGNELILVVEDDELVRKYFARCFSRLGYRIELCQSGPEALERIDAGIRPDLMLSDIVMPGGLGGVETAIEARRRLPELKVLFTSGYPRETLVSRGRVAEDTPLLDKPFRTAALARLVADTLQAPACTLPVPGSVQAS